MRISILMRSAVASLALLAAAVTHQRSISAFAEPQLVFTTIDFPGAIGTTGQGINAGGEVVGFYTDTGTPSRIHGFLFTGGQFVSIDVPGAGQTMARGIGPSGDIVGSYQRTNESGAVPAHGFLRDVREDFHAVNFPNHLNTIAQRILPDGTILGCYHDTDTGDSMHGMTYSRGQFEGIEQSMSMNNGATPNGKLIIGLFTDTDNRGKGYMIDRGRFHAFEVPGATQTAAWDINPAGLIVGLYRDAAGRLHGFQYDGDQTFTSIDFPGARATRVFGINANGDMVGGYADNAGRNHGFLAQWTTN